MVLASILAAALICASEPAPALSSPVTITVHPDKVLNRITPWMTGSCIEDVNHEVYGGIYSQMIFGESFEEPPVDLAMETLGFKRFGGRWSLQNEYLEEPGGPGPRLLAPVEVGDGEVSVDIFFPKPKDQPAGYQNAGLVARVREAGNGADAFIGYEISLSPLANHVLLGRHRHDWKPLKEVPFAVPTEKWLRLKAAFRGAEIEVSVDGKSVLTFTDPEPLAPGSAGLRTWNRSARFRDFAAHGGDKEWSSNLRRDPAAAGPPREVSAQWKGIVAGKVEAELRIEDGGLNGKRCQKIALRSGEGEVGIENRGLNGWGLALSGGKPYEGFAYLEAAGEAAVTFALLDDDGKAIAEEEVVLKAGAPAFTRVDFALTPRRDAAKGRFAILLRKPGAVRVDQVFLQPGPWGRFRGLPVRKDLADGLLAEGLTLLRYGGSMVNAPEYRWKNMIGPRELRPPYRGTWYPDSTNGWGIIDFIAFCEKASLLAVPALNIEETPQALSDFIEYVNGPAESAWGRRRAEDGHPAPFGLRHVEIGNEETLDEHYLERFRILSNAMHARDPGLTFIIAAWFDEKNPVSQKLIEASRGKQVLWDVHVGGDGLRDADRDGKAIERMRHLFREWCPEAGVRVCILEENGGRHDLQRALGHAHMVSTMERLGDFVLIDCPANCLQALGQNDNGWDQGQLFYLPGKAWGMPPYHAQQMIAACHRPLAVAAEASGAGDALDVTATRSEDGRSVVLKLVNLEGSAVKASIEVAGFGPSSPTARVTVLSGELAGRNTPDEPERIVPRERMIRAAGARWPLELEPHSFTVVEIERAAPGSR
jgi:alpha-L-arabinofuranosidase